MVTPDLVRYVKTQLWQGVSKEKIKEILLAAGWKDTDIEEAFLLIIQTVPPPPPSPPSSSEPSLTKLDPSNVVSGQSVKISTQEKNNWEISLGVNWLVKIGILALILGTGFFLKWAFDNNIIGITGRLVLGLIGGSILIMIGDYFRSKYRIYSQLLVGGGFAILFLANYGAFYYNVVGFTFSFWALVFISGIAAVLAIKEQALSVAFVGFLGAYITPIFFLDFFGYHRENIEKSFFHGFLPLYLIILGFGFLLVSAFRNWQKFIWLGFIGTWSWYTFWDISTENVTFWQKEFYLVVYFLIFVGATILYHLIWKKKTDKFDAIFIFANALVFFIFSYNTILYYYKDYSFIGILPIALATFYIVLGYLSFFRYQEDKLLPISLGGAGILFLILTPPVQFDYYWVIIAWSAQGAIFSLIGFYSNLREIRIIAFGLLLFTIIYLFGNLYFIKRLPLLSGMPLVFFNQKFLIFVIVSLTCFFVSYLYYRWLRSSNLIKNEKYFLIILVLAGNIVLLFGFTIDLTDEFDQRISAELYKKSIEIKKIRNEITEDLSQTRKAQGDIDQEFFDNYFDYTNDYYIIDYNDYNLFEDQRYIELNKNLSNKIKKLRNTENILISLLWLIYAFVILFVGILRHIYYLRIFGISILSLVILKAFLFDVFSLGGGWRVASLISLAMILLVSGYLYNRFSSKIKQFLLKDEQIFN